MSGFYTPSKVPQAADPPVAFRPKDWDVIRHIGFGGTHCLWHMYSCVHKKTRQPGTAFVFDRKVVEKQLVEKASPEHKPFLELIKREATFPVRASLGNMATTILSPMQDDAGVLYYVTEPFVCSLAFMHYAFGFNNVSKVRYVAETEKANDLNKGFKATFNKAAFSYILQYCAPDMVCYGLLSLLKELAFFHSNEIVFGNITPANVCISETGEWKLVGYAFSSLSGLSFDFSSETGSLLRPSCRFMAPSMISTKKTTKQSDTFQIAALLYNVFSEKQCSCRSPTPNAKHLSTPELISHALKMYGIGTTISEDTYAPKVAEEHAQMVSKYFVVMQNNAVGPDTYCYKDMPHVLQPLAAAAKEGSDCNAIIDVICVNCQVAKICVETFEHKLTSAFTQKPPEEVGGSGMLKTHSHTQMPGSSESTSHVPDVSALAVHKSNLEMTKDYFESTLMDAATNSVLSQDFVHAVLFSRVTDVLCRRDIHTYTIPVFLTFAFYLALPLDYIFTLLEPLVISCTMASKRPEIREPIRAFHGGVLWYGKQYSYTSPYSDMPLEKSVKERAKFIPNFDAQLVSSAPGTTPQIDLLICLLGCYQTFLHARAGQQSHFTFFNMMLGGLQSRNAQAFEAVCDTLADSAPYMVDTTCWLTKSVRDSTEYWQTYCALCEMVGASPGTPDASGAIGGNYPAPYNTPVSSILIPTLAGVLKNTKDPKMLAPSLSALEKLSSFLTVEELGSAVMPAIYEATSTIVSSALGICAFAKFAAQVHERCTARTVATLFLPPLINGMYRDDFSSGAAIEEVRKSVEKLYRFVSKSASSASMDLGSAAAPATDQPAAEAVEDHAGYY